MSFSIYLLCCENGAFCTFKRSIAYDIFGDYIFPARAGLELWYGNEFNGVIGLDDEVEITGVSVNRPGDKAIRGLYELARLTPSVIYWGKAACAVADAPIIPGIHKAILDGMGAPTVVHSAEELCLCIAGRI